MARALEVSSDDFVIRSPGQRSLQEILELKYGARKNWNWGPALRAHFDYVTPDDFYEAVVFDFVSRDTSWLDVGCGRDIFPSNFTTAKILAERCNLLVGIDPDDNIDENTLVHRKEKTFIEKYQTDIRFDLVTLRMVVEHVSEPEATVQSLARVTKSGGHVIVYTVSKWSPVSIFARLTPTSVHRLVKRVIWQSEDKDTFPTVYKMNTHSDLKRLFEGSGFVERRFEYLDDCRSFQRWKIPNYFELGMRSLLHRLRIGYPETCILGIYKKL